MGCICKCLLQVDVIAAGRPTAHAKLWPVGAMIQRGHGLGGVFRLLKLTPFCFNVHGSQSLLHGVDVTAQCTLERIMNSSV